MPPTNPTDVVEEIEKHHKNTVDAMGELIKWACDHGWRNYQDDRRLESVAGLRDLAFNLNVDLMALGRENARLATEVERLKYRLLGIGIKIDPKVTEAMKENRE